MPLPRLTASPEATPEISHRISNFADEVHNNAHDYSRAAVMLGAHVMSPGYHIDLKSSLPARNITDSTEAYRQLHTIFLHEYDRYMEYDEATARAIATDVKIVARHQTELQHPTAVPLPEVNPTMLVVASNEFSGPTNQMVRLTSVSIYIRRVLRHQLQAE